MEEFGERKQPPAEPPRHVRPDRRPSGRQLGELLGAEQLLEAIACPRQHRTLLVVLHPQNTGRIDFANQFRY